MLKGKKILLGISGGIAAYKSAFLVRLFVKYGAEVKVVLTPAALDFVTPLTLSTLSKNPVFSDFTEDADTGEWTNHVELGLWADAMIIAPATSNTLGKMATGQSDNFLLATYMSAKCPVFISPAMDLDMYQHPATKENLDKLASFGNTIIPAGTGELASGLSGEGRMAEPEDICQLIIEHFNPKLSLKGKHFLISAGPTHEAIDPVRYLGNNSSGKMGYELAKAALNLGASVTLVSGPSQETLSHPKLELIKVKSAQEMFEAMTANFDASDVCIKAAAVADYTPLSYSDTKLKKKEGDLNIALKRTKDILAELGKQKKKQLLIGFALESENGLENAKGKLERKNLDAIILNTLADKGAGFQHDTNKITIIESNNNMRTFELKSKSKVAEDIINFVLEKIC